METIFMNTENSQKNEPDRFRLTLLDKLKGPRTNMVLANLSIYYAWKNIKSAYNSNKFKISAPTWNDEFDFDYIFEKHGTITDNLPVQIYTNKIKNRIVFKIKTGYKLELLSSESIKLLGSTAKDVDQDKDGEDVPKLKSVEVILYIVI